MEIITITARISEQKEVEFYQTMESLKTLVKNFCKALEIKVQDNNNVTINITFDEKKDLEKNFYNNEFNIFKGTVKSLCNNSSIKIN